MSAPSRQADGHCCVEEACGACRSPRRLFATHPAYKQRIRALLAANPALHGLLLPGDRDGRRPAPDPAGGGEEGSVVSA